ncbi:MAG: dephospho-CoA kinase [Flavobacteriales bacterium]|nr:dephospho-CoA kinase [Flavobacteriales bacterium]
MLKVGLTGGIGSGKTVVAGVFGVLGVPVFQADAEARAIMQSDEAVKAALEARFGASIYSGGILDRKAMAAIIFRDAEALRLVNGIVHPAVRAAFDRWALAQSGPYAIMEAALMAENGGWRRFDQVVVVACSEAERIRRVMARDGVTEEEVRARMSNQASEAERLAIAHHVVRNEGAELVIPQVLAIHEKLKAAP